MSRKLMASALMFRREEREREWITVPLVSANTFFQVGEKGDRCIECFIALNLKTSLPG